MVLDLGRAAARECVVSPAQLSFVANQHGQSRDSALSLSCPQDQLIALRLAAEQVGKKISVHDRRRKPTYSITWDASTTRPGVTRLWVTLVLRL